MTQNWHVVESNPRAETVASEAVKALGIPVYLPQYVLRVRKGRRVDLVKRALLPRYFFADFATDHPRWPSIFSRIGVRRVICDESRRPRRVPDVEMARLRVLAGSFADTVREDVPLTPGQVVAIIDGAFAGRLATVAVADPHKQTVTVTCDMLGGAVPVIVPRASVAPAA
jgi:transcription antitermination factor NusG